MDGGIDGLDLLLRQLEESGSGPLPLPGLDEPMAPCTYVRMILGGCRERGMDFEPAWAAAINRLQPSQLGGAIEIGVVEALRQDRALLEESRGYYRAAYENRAPTPRERAETSIAAWSRIEGVRAPMSNDVA